MKLARFANCRLRGSQFYAVLSDGSEVEWSVYCADKRAELQASA